MPITPYFKLSQSSTQLVIIIRIPHIRVSASTIEVVVEGTEFHFFSSPYLLHLSFPHNLLDDAESCREAKATYDPSDKNGTLTVTIWKEEEGLWDNLDLLSNLINRSDGMLSIREQESKISVLSSTENENNHEEDGDNTEECLTNKSLMSCLRPTYGFLNSFHSILKDYCREGLSHDMLEIPEPDEIPNEDRRELRIITENQKFDPDRYLGDLFLSNNPEDDDADMVFVEATQMVPHWQSNKVETSDDADAIFFSEEESLRLVEIKTTLPHIESISPEQTKSLFLSLIDILYAYAYDHRTTSGEPTCESSWTITMLSSTLSWFESYTPPYDDVAQVARWSIRRAVTYPYLRNFHFVSEILVKDVGDIINAGRRVVIRCLLQIQKILESSEFHYLFNKLYINPYICWIQKISDDDLSQFAKEFNEVIGLEHVFAKHTFEFELDVIEQCAIAEGEIQSIEDASISSDSEGHSGSSYSSESSSAESGEINALKEQDDDIDKVTRATKSILLDDQIGSGILRVENLVTSLPASSDGGSKSKKEGKNKHLITEI